MTTAGSGPRASAVVAIYASGAGPLLPTVRPVMRAELAKLKSQRDDMIIAPGKQSAARGYGRKMISSFFPSGLARRRRAKPEGKKEAGWEGSLPRAAASRLHPITARQAAALPGAIIAAPPGLGKGEPGGCTGRRASGFFCISGPLARRQ